MVKLKYPKMISKRKSGGYFGNLFDDLTYTDLENGIVRLEHEIGPSETSSFSAELREAIRLGNKKITVMITSPGGGAYHALSLYDQLQRAANSGIEIIAIVDGIAASAAAMIVLQSANNRLAGKNARFLLHEVREWIFFSVETESSLEDKVVEMQAITNQIVDILSNRCNKSSDEIRSLIKRKEIWMSAKEAFSFGLIDKII